MKFEKNSEKSEKDSPDTGDLRIPCVPDTGDLWITGVPDTEDSRIPGVPDEGKLAWSLKNSKKKESPVYRPMEILDSPASQTPRIRNSLVYRTLGSCFKTLISR